MIAALLLMQAVVATAPIDGAAVEQAQADARAAAREAAAAKALAASAPTKQDLAAVSAAIPVPAATVPPTEMVGGKAGTAGTYRPADAAQPRITRAAVVTTNASGAWTVTWSTSLPDDPVSLPVPVNATAEPVVCNVTTTTKTGASGRCWYARPLPATISLLSALVNFSVFGASAAGITVQLLAIPKTQ